MPAWLRTTISLIFIILTILGMVNVYSNNDDVVQMAAKKACDNCETHLVQMGRSPIAQTLSFQLGSTKQVVTVECQRALVLLGDYECETVQ